MSNENATLTTLQEWWEFQNFPGKNNYTVNENGELIQKAIGQFKERVISALTPDNAEITLKALRDKFTETQARWKELQTEWESTEDKLKLIGKVERMKDYLQHTSVVGEVDAFEKVLAVLDETLTALTQENYLAKLKLAEQAEALSETNTCKESTQAFKDLAEEWKKIGYVDKYRNDELWNRIETAKNNFFERKRQNQEDINKELLQNLDLKMELVEKAESFAASESWKETTEAFNQLMEAWKKTGRTIHEKNEALWHRFITAKNSFFDRKKAHADKIQAEQESNLAAKLALIEKANALKESTDWGATAQAFTELMEEWKKTGRVPAEKSDEIWNQFLEAKDYFFKAKKAHSETLRVTLQDNYAQKLALVKRAESLQHSTNWREATDEMMELMEEWKKIGPAPREHHNAIWEQFSMARKKFFERKDANREHRKQMAEKHKSQRIERANSFVQKLEEELKEEEERLEDFKAGLENITPGERKAAELKAHLEKLIEQTINKINHKREKLGEARKQGAISEE